MKGIVVGVVFLMQGVFASLSVYNDSAFPLRVEVLGANGVILGKKEIPSHMQDYIEDQIGNSDPVGQGQDAQDFKNYARSLTPYQVYWYCPDGTLYSSCLNVSAGATVTANSCSGTYTCPSCQEGDRLE